MEELTLDEFGKIIDDFLTKNHIQMMIEMPEGAQDVLLEDNAGLGPVVQFYILLKALPAVYRGFRSMLAPDEESKFIDETLKLVRNEILDDIKKQKDSKLMDCDQADGEKQ